MKQRSGQYKESLSSRCPLSHQTQILHISMQHKEEAPARVVVPPVQARLTLSSEDNEIGTKTPFIKY